jgi:hypothetical protein
MSYWPLWNICVTNDHGYVPLVVNTSWPFPHSWLITGFVSKLTRRVSLVAKELLTLPKHLFSPPVGIVLIDLSFMCMFCRSFLSFYLFYFGHCVVCPSSIYGFWLPFWYLQTLLIEVPVPRQESEQSFICVLSVSIFPWSTICKLDLRIVSAVW